MPRMKKQSLGRPTHVYGQSATDFSSTFSSLPKFTKYRDALTESGFGAVGYMLSERSKQHLARLMLRPTDRAGEFWWARVETPRGEVGWSCPSLIAARHLDELVERWEFDVNTAWVEGAPGSPVFPMEWNMPGEFVFSKKRFLTLAYHETSKHHSLVARGGIHTMTARALGGRNLCAGIIGEDSHLVLVEAAAKLGTDVSVLTFPASGLSREVLSFLFSASALYTYEKVIVEANGSAHGVVPHSEVINLPITTVRRFEP